MPIFEYKCASCDKLFETLVRADTRPTCPNCGGTYLAKQLSVFAASTTGSSNKRESAPANCGSHVCGSGCALH